MYPPPPKYREPIGVNIPDPGFKIGQEIRDALKQGKPLCLVVRPKKPKP